MKKYFPVFAFIFLFVVVFGLIATETSANGDKVRGDESDGPSYQLGECPFTG